jgi:hypothetical protein
MFSNQKQSEVAMSLIITVCKKTKKKTTRLTNKQAKNKQTNQSKPKTIQNKNAPYLAGPIHDQLQTSTLPCAAI